jgi:hypothetical protein
MNFTAHRQLNSFQCVPCLQGEQTDRFTVEFKSGTLAQKDWKMNTQFLNASYDILHRPITLALILTNRRCLLFTLHRGRHYFSVHSVKYLPHGKTFHIKVVDLVGYLYFMDYTRFFTTSSSFRRKMRNFSLSFMWSRNRYKPKCNLLDNSWYRLLSNNKNLFYDAYSTVDIMYHRCLDELWHELFRIWKEATRANCLNTNLEEQRKSTKNFSRNIWSSNQKSNRAFSPRSKNANRSTQSYVRHQTY